MRGALLHGPRDMRFEERDAPRIVKPTDALIRMSATCVCGSDLWPYRGISPVAELLALVARRKLNPGRLVTRQIGLADVTDTLERMTRFDTVGFEVVTRFA